MESNVFQNGSYAERIKEYKELNERAVRAENEIKHRDFRRDLFQHILFASLCFFAGGTITFLIIMFLVLK